MHENDKEKENEQKNSIFSEWWFPAVEVKVPGDFVLKWSRCQSKHSKQEPHKQKSQIKTHLQLYGFKWCSMCLCTIKFSLNLKANQLAIEHKEKSRTKGERAKWEKKKLTRDLKWLSGTRVKKKASFGTWLLWYFEGRLFVIALNTSRARVSVPVFVFLCRFFACSSKRYVNLGTHSVGNYRTCECGCIQRDEQNSSKCRRHAENVQPIENKKRSCAHMWTKTRIANNSGWAWKWKTNALNTKTDFFFDGDDKQQQKIQAAKN